ncbi:MAG: AAA family ATPase [Chlamydiia bacterium]|nr:AAA family ATPase [Chlamydiia bacterium]
MDELFLEKYLAKRTGCDQVLATELIRLSRLGHLCLHSSEEKPTQGSIVRKDNRYYLQKNWDYESRILAQLERLMQRDLLALHKQELFEKELSSAPLQPEQAAAIRRAFFHSFSLICGGPGTGKTYTAAHLVRLLTASFQGPYYVALAAPTGKAASHLEKTINASSRYVTASTLHRLLKSSSRIDADLVLVDEGSMIDVSLWTRLLESIGDTTRLVILGDPEQLPPVEAGHLFADLSPRFGFTLSRCMRTDVPELHATADAIRRGDADVALQLLSPQPTLDIDHLFQQIAPWTGPEKPEPSAILQHYRRLGVLNALRQGPFGSDALQTQLLQRLASRVQEHWWAIPILVTKNEPRLDLYNGTYGILVGKTARALLNLQGTAYFENSAYSAPPPIEPAFCLSIHKSQGSEFERVIAIFPEGSERLGRAALYTAVTRAKKQLQCVGAESTLRAMVANHERRASGLS